MPACPYKANGLHVTREVLKCLLNRYGYCKAVERTISCPSCKLQVVADRGAAEDGQP